MKTEYFIELFERSHQYIDCDCARCKNSRQMAIGIIGTLFRDSKCVSIIKKKEDYSKQELIELFLQHVGTGLPILTRKKSSILTLGCQLSDRQMDLLVELVQSHDIFDFADNSDVRSELCRLFKCDLDASIRVKNVRNVAVLFDAMAQYHLINNNWQYVMGEGRFLTSIKKDGTEKFITSSCLSSSLSLHNGNDLLAKYKSNAPQEQKVSSEDWMKKILSSEDSGVGISGTNDPILDMAMTTFMSLMMLAAQIDSNDEERQKGLISAMAANRLVDLTSLVPGMRQCTITVGENGKTVLHAESGTVKIDRELTSSEMNRLSLILGNANLSEESKRTKIAGMVTGIVATQQASQNFEQGMEAESQQQNLQRK